MTEKRDDEKKGGNTKQDLVDLSSLDPAILWLYAFYDWGLWARKGQVPPEKFRTWLILAGRGFGKTRTGAEWVRARAENGTAKRIGLVGPTIESARTVMIEGESGLLNVCPPWNRPKWYPSKNELHWPNGAMATVYSAEEPERLRGPQFDTLWVDELAAWKGFDAWDMARLALRLGDNPQSVITTTPKPLPFLEKLMKEEGVVTTRGTTYDNADNLAPAFMKEILKKYEGTRIGDQELNGQILSGGEGALFKRDALERLRLEKVPDDLETIVVAIDPAVTNNAKSDETGIMVVGLKKEHAYVLEDASGKMSPNVWARRAVELFHKYEADRIVAEVNQGGDLVEQMIQAQAAGVVPVRGVRATRGKATRAEPVVSLYEQGRVHHVGYFSELETQMCTPIGSYNKSPDRVDALVWAIFDLLLGPSQLPPSFNVWSV